MRLRYPFGRLKCHNCKLPSEGLWVSKFDGATRSYAWCGACKPESCWDCGAVGKFLFAPIRDDKDYRICEACYF